MKQLIFILLALLSVECALAQNKNKNSEFKQQLLEAKAQKMKEALELSNDKFEKFLPLYEAYEQEVNQVSINNKPSMTYGKAIEANVDAATAKEIISTQFANSNRLLEVKTKYLELFAEIFSGIELIKFYQTEVTIRTKIRKEFLERTAEKKANNPNKEKN